MRTYEYIEKERIVDGQQDDSYLFREHHPKGIRTLKLIYRPTISKFNHGLIALLVNEDGKIHVRMNISRILIAKLIGVMNRKDIVIDFLGPHHIAVSFRQHFNKEFIKL